MSTRRQFLNQPGLVASASLLDTAFSHVRPAAPLPAPTRTVSLWAVSAGVVRVSPGQWTPFLPNVASGVHLENIRLQMPDGVRLNAFLYLPASVSRSQKVPGLMNTLPYRYKLSSDSYFASFR